MNRAVHPLEELFRGSRKVLRVLRLFLLDPETPHTKYAVENRALVYDVEPVLKRLVALGVLRVVDEKPRRYVLNTGNPLVRAVERMMRDVGYI
ncbi:MAG: hypothetical protein DRK00_07505 [Thermoprotei archaeon]|nr:MAG: hypothetical protein DRK00_07505 [Thermoprotei archaeon]